MEPPLDCEAFNLGDDWLPHLVIALGFYVIFPIFILSGLIGLWRTRTKPPEWRARVRMTRSGAVSRDRYQFLLATLVVEGVVGMIVFSFLASIVEA
jgi:hypothetical protein